MKIRSLHHQELVAMNKSDIRLIIGIIAFTLIPLIIFVTKEQKDEKTAVIYYQNEVIQTIDLTRKESKEYIVEGKNGPVIIEVNNGRIRVKQEDSPLHICSKQGYISKNTETIVCLPNKIVILIQDKNSLDTVVR